MKKISVIAGGAIFMLSSSLFAFAGAEKSNADEDTLKSVMQGLLKDSLQINKGIFTEDFTMIEGAAKRVADHPTPGMLTKMKLASNLGSEMGRFKGFDDVVHNGALRIAKAAKEKNMDLVATEYYKLMEGCLACHGTFKTRVAEILK